MVNIKTYIMCSIQSYVFILKFERDIRKTCKRKKSPCSFYDLGENQVKFKKIINDNYFWYIKHTSSERNLIIWRCL